MKPGDGSQGDPVSMSRAAKKRAKKKQKKQQMVIQDDGLDDTVGSKRPFKDESPLQHVEGREHDQSTSSIQNNKPKKSKKSHDCKNGGGILKSPKYTSTIRNTDEDEDEDGGNDNNHDDDDRNKSSSHDVVFLSEDIRDLLRSEQVALADLLLLEKNSKSNKGCNKNSSDTTFPCFSSLTSQQRARGVLAWLLAPNHIAPEEFYEDFWEKEALCIQDTTEYHRHRLDGLLSLAKIRQLLDQQTLHYGKDLNVTKYTTQRTKNGEQRKFRKNLDDPPSVDPVAGERTYVPVDAKQVWKNYDQEGCTVRLLCPHKHNDTIHSLLSVLELEFGCMIGANAYLTPPRASQGFAPHYDDIEAFCLQLEGKKRWKVYKPRSKAEQLPRTSSEDFNDESDLADLELAMDVVLSPGDLLYMPRGWIHQAATLSAHDDDKQQHALHLTVSAMQHWSWVDYLELLMPEALEAAARSETSTNLRQGLPRNFLEYMGAMHAEVKDSELPKGLQGNDLDQEEGAGNTEEEMDSAEVDERERRKQRLRLQETFRAEAKKRIMRVAKEAMDMIDAACDQMGKRFLSDRLPPALTPQELAYTSEGQRDATIWPHTLCRLARPGIARLALEDEGTAQRKAVVYHCNDNSRAFHEVPLSPLEYEIDDAPAIEQLITTVEPYWICIGDLIHESIEDKISIAQSLYDEGILAIKNDVESHG